MNEKNSGIISGERLIKEIIGDNKREQAIITCEKWEDCTEEYEDNDKHKDCNIKCYEGLNWDNFNGWQVDLNLGREAYITGNKKPTILDKGEYLTIEPGDFALLETEEKINLPSDLMGFISVRFKYKKMGLVNISGFHVDPCYEGKLIFSVYNAGPDDIIMQQGSPVFMIFFLTLTHSLKELDADVKDNADYIFDELKDRDEKFSEREGYSRIPLNLISMIQGSSVSLSKNNNRIDKLESNLKIYGSIIGGILIALFGTLIAQLL